MYLKILKGIINQFISGGHHPVGEHYAKIEVYRGILISACYKPFF